VTSCANDKNNGTKRLKMALSFSDGEYADLSRRKERLEQKADGLSKESQKRYWARYRHEVRHGLRTPQPVQKKTPEEKRAYIREYRRNRRAQGLDK